MSNRALVLDANILIRAVLGVRVRRILENHADSVSFFVPELALSEAREHLATLVKKRGGDPARFHKDQRFDMRRVGRRLNSGFRLR
jgi:predicted nucleic acid-binding protein